MTKFYTYLKIIWEELESLKLILICKCDILCNCILSKVIISYRESEYVLCFSNELSEISNTV